MHFLLILPSIQNSFYILEEHVYEFKNAFEFQQYLLLLKKKLILIYFIIYSLTNIGATYQKI